MEMKLIVNNRLTQLGCEKLPQPVRDAILADFSCFAESQCQKHAKRRITIPKVAKHLTEFLKENCERVINQLDSPVQVGCQDNLIGYSELPLVFLPGEQATS